MQLVSTCPTLWELQVHRAQGLPPSEPFLCTQLRGTDECAQAESSGATGPRKGRGPQRPHNISGVQPTNLFPLKLQILQNKHQTKPNENENWEVLKG